MRWPWGREAHAGLVPGTRAGDIIQVMGIGFTIGDRLLRPAQVGVSSGGPAMPARPPEA